MNPIILALIATDFFVFTGLGLTGPIFAIFIERSVVGGSIAAAGIAQTIYMIVKAVLQLFVGRFNDRDPMYLREYWTALVGYAIIAVVPFLYIAVDTIAQLYAVQAFFGIGAAFAYPGFMTIFTRFTDRQREGLEWSTYSTIVFLGMAVSAAVGGWSVERYGFDRTFIAVGFLSVIGCIAFASLWLRYAELHRDHHPPKRHPRDVPPVK
ncbi:MFS transporter [Candidatus Uhrbacteria bacterium]|nr:MFS transporter [Candidatus Uhrbacteria bacterium]